MKNNFLNLLMALILITINTSCQKENATDNNTITEEEVAVVVEQALVSNTEGLTMQVEESAKISEESSAIPCSTALDSTIIKTSDTGALRTFDYEFNWSWELICNNVIPQSFNFNYTSTGVYDTPRISSDDNGTFDFNVTGLSPSQDYLFYNGNYTRNGTQVSKIRNENEFNSTLTFNTTDLKVQKSTQKIESGTATFILTGSVLDGESFSHEGTIIFLGNGAATIEINGQTYNIQL